MSVMEARRMCRYLRSASIYFTVWECSVWTSSSASSAGESSLSLTSCSRRLTWVSLGSISRSSSGTRWESLSAFHSYGKVRTTCSRWRTILDSFITVLSPSILTSARSQTPSSSFPQQSRARVHQAVLTRGRGDWESRVSRNYRSL